MAGGEGKALAERIKAAAGILRINPHRRGEDKQQVAGARFPDWQTPILAQVYEPKAPAPSQRLAALRAAHDAGLHVYVAVAPTYPECDEADLRATLRAIADLNPVTIFHEPINIRAENVERINSQAGALGISLKTDVFDTRERWQDYAVNALKTVERIAKELALSDQLHLWPDKSLGNAAIAGRMSDPKGYSQWLTNCWTKISAWP